MSDSVGIGFWAATKRLMTPSNKWDWYLVWQLTAGFVGWIAVIVVGSIIGVGQNWPVVVATVCGMMMGSVVPLWFFGKAIPKLFRRLMGKPDPHQQVDSEPEFDIDAAVRRADDILVSVRDQRGAAYSDPKLIFTKPELDNTELPEVARLSRVLESMEEFTDKEFTRSRAKSYLEAALRLEDGWNAVSAAADRLGTSRCTAEERQMLLTFSTAAADADDPWRSHQQRLDAAEIAEQAIRNLPPSSQSVISSNLKKWAIFRMLEIRAEVTNTPVESLSDPA